METGNLQKKHYLLVIGTVAAIFILGVVGLSVVYAGKVFPGVSANGVDIGGLSVDEAGGRIATRAAAYNGELIPIEYNKTVLRVPVSSLAVTYNNGAAAAAYKYGRSGNLAHQFAERLRALLGRPAAVTRFNYDDAKLTPYLTQVASDVDSPVSNASLNFNGGQIGVTASTPGHRLDIGGLTLAIEQRLGSLSSTKIQASVSQLPPSINEEALGAARHKADAFIAGPIVLQMPGRKDTISQDKVLSWVDVTTPSARSGISLDWKQSFYPLVTSPVVNISANQTKVEIYVAELAKSVNREPKNAELAFRDGAVQIAEPSHSGLQLDQAKTTRQIVSALAQGANNRNLTLAVNQTTAAVNENNLGTLGIKELISEGVTYFPGSPSTRITNIRVGAARFNDTLVAPGEVFSFGKVLGDVGPAQGYVPELVILADHEEKQYGGGLCQVASTAYRGALLAGLPIVQRTNHSFAVSYYTAPYGVPGVDATIYYPAVDLKFKNDTPAYILIQTILQGTTLKFDFYGTKTKEGIIRGPQFISGTTDATKPSQTVFWRDIKDLAGNVIKTDTISTHYKSSKDFPINHQFN